MSSILKLAEQAALAAGQSIHDSINDLCQLEVEQKHPHDYVSEVDRNAERIIVEMIRQSYADHQVVGEEYGRQGSNTSEYQWVIDPLDGTTNFLRGIPHFAVSVAVLNNGVPEVGVVYDPVKQDLFCAAKGRGAKLNGETIEVSSRTSIKGALLATGVPYSGDNLQLLQAFTNAMTGLLEQQTSGLRRLGAAALDLAYVAAGRYEGFWESGLHVWDIAAGALLVKEAGGTVSDLQGGDEFMRTGHILAATPAVHTDMLKVTSKCYPL